MKICFAGVLLALIAWAVALHAADPPSLTWQQANARSAEIINTKGPNKEAADLAQQAFDLYPSQTKKYAPKVHVQLLLNLMSLRDQTDGLDAALAAADRGADAIGKAAGDKEPLLYDVRLDAIRIARGSSDYGAMDVAHKRAIALGEALWGPGDPRVLKARLDWVLDLRPYRGLPWTEGQLEETLRRARDDSPVVALIELALVKTDLERSRWKTAISGYERLIERLEQRDDPGYGAVLQLAYGQVAYAYERTGNKEGARSARERLLRTLGQSSSELVPLVRTSPKVKQPRNGFVEMLVTVDETGAVSDAVVVTSEPAGVHDKYALEAVRQWKFAPKVVDGKPVPHRGLQRIVYEGY